MAIPWDGWCEAKAQASVAIPWDSGCNRMLPNASTDGGGTAKSRRDRCSVMGCGAKVVVSVVWGSGQLFLVGLGPGFASISPHVRSDAPRPVA